jgi:hypothetical protein
MSDDAEEFSVQAVSAYHVFGASHILERILAAHSMRGIESAVASQKIKTPAFGP